MHGRPIIEWVLFVLLWCLLLFPLSKLTARPVALVHSDAQGDTASQTVWAELQFSHVPCSFWLREEGHDIWGGTSTVYQIDKQVKVAVVNDRVELELVVEWEKSDGMKAVELSLEPDGLEGQSRTCWSIDQKMKEIVVFEW